VGRRMVHGAPTYAQRAVGPSPAAGGSQGRSAGSGRTPARRALRRPGSRDHPHVTRIADPAADAARAARYLDGPLGVRPERGGGDRGRRVARRSLQALSHRSWLFLAVRRRARDRSADPGAPVTAPWHAEPSAGAELPLSTRAAMFQRLLAVQASWNYETMLGNGIG